MKKDPLLSPLLVFDDSSCLLAFNNFSELQCRSRGGDEFLHWEISSSYDTTPWYVVSKKKIFCIQVTKIRQHWLFVAWKSSKIWKNLRWNEIFLCQNSTKIHLFNERSEFYNWMSFEKVLIVAMKNLTRNPSKSTCHFQSFANPQKFLGWSIWITVNPKKKGGNHRLNEIYKCIDCLFGYSTLWLP